MLQAVLTDLDADGPRAVWADWLLDREDPDDRALGALINRERAEGQSLGVLRDYAALWPRVLGDLAPILQPTSLQLGMPVAGVVRGGRPDLLDHPQLDALRRIETADPAVAGIFAGSVERLWVRSPEALLAVASQSRRVTELHVDAGALLPDLPSLAVDTLVLRVAGSAPTSLRRWVSSVLVSPIRRVRIDAPLDLDPALERQLDAHPTLKCLVWHGGFWGDPSIAAELVEPLGGPWRGPPQLGDAVPGLHPVRRIAGGQRAVWLVHHAGQARLAVFRREDEPLLDVPGVQAPVTTLGFDPVVELYPAELEPLGALPWPERDREAFQSVAERCEIWSPGADLSAAVHAFHAPDGSLCLVGPPARPTTAPAGPTPRAGLLADLSPHPRLDWAASIVPRAPDDLPLLFGPAADLPQVGVLAVPEPDELQRPLADGAERASVVRGLPGTVRSSLTPSVLELSRQVGLPLGFAELVEADEGVAWRLGWHGSVRVGTLVDGRLEYLRSGGDAVVPVAEASRVVLVTRPIVEAFDPSVLAGLLTGRTPHGACDAVQEAFVAADGWRSAAIVVVDARASDTDQQETP